MVNFNKINEYILNNDFDNIKKYYIENKFSYIQDDEEGNNILEILAYSNNDMFQLFYNELSKEEKQKLNKKNNYDLFKACLEEKNFSALKTIIQDINLKNFYNSFINICELSNKEKDEALLTYLENIDLTDLNKVFVSENIDIGFLTTELNLGKSFSYLIENDYSFSKFNSHEFLKQIAIERKSYSIIGQLALAGVNFEKKEIDNIIGYLNKNFDLELFNSMLTDVYFATIVNKNGNQNILLNTLINKNYDAVDYLTSLKKIKYDAVDSNGNNALIISSELSDNILLNKFLNYKFDKNHKDSQGNTAAMYLVLNHNNDGLVNFLKNESFSTSGIVIKNENHISPILQAVEQEYFFAIEQFLKLCPPLSNFSLERQENIKLEEVEEFNIPGIDLVEEKMPILQELNHKGFDFNFSVDNKNTNLVLNYIIKNGSFEDIKNLIYLGSDPSKKNDDGVCAISYALKNNFDYVYQIYSTGKVDLANYLDELQIACSNEENLKTSKVRKLFNLTNFIDKDIAVNILKDMIDKEISLEDNIDFSNIVYSGKFSYDVCADLLEKMINKNNLDSEKLMVYTYIKEHFDNDYFNDLLSICNNNDDTLKNIINKDFGKKKKLKIK